MRHTFGFMSRSPEVRDESCAVRLRGLPTELQPPYNWQEFRRRAQGPSRGSARWEQRWQAAAVLALFLLAIGAAVWRGHGTEPSRETQLSRRDASIEEPMTSQHAARIDEPATDTRAPNTEEPRTDPRAAAEQAVDAAASISAIAVARGGTPPGAPPNSRQIEFWLHSLPHEPAVVRVGTRAAVAGLEDRIAQVDDLLTAERLEGAGRDRVAALQKERATLVRSLAQVRYAEVVASAVP